MIQIATNAIGIFIALVIYIFMSELIASLIKRELIGPEAPYSVSSYWGRYNQKAQFIPKKRLLVAAYALGLTWIIWLLPAVIIEAVMAHVERRNRIKHMGYPRTRRRKK
jgi:TM2 domain-containing membrane protein YozV